MRPNLLRMLIFLMSWSLLFVLLSFWWWSFGSHINSIAWFSIYPCLHTDLSYWWIWNDSWENKTIIKWQMESKNSQTSWCEMKIIFEIALRDDCCIISFAFHIPFAISSIETSWFPLHSCSVWECPTEWVWIEWSIHVHQTWNKDQSTWTCLGGWSCSFPRVLSTLKSGSSGGFKAYNTFLHLLLHIQLFRDIFFLRVLLLWRGLLKLGVFPEHVVLSINKENIVLFVDLFVINRNREL